MEARFLKSKRAEIVAYLETLGITELNYEQKTIIERICYLELHIKLADIKAMQTPFSDIGARTYAGFSTAIPRLMERLRGKVPVASDADDERTELHGYIEQMAGAQ